MPPIEHYASMIKIYWLSPAQRASICPQPEPEPFDPWPSRIDQGPAGFSTDLQVLQNRVVPPGVWLKKVWLP